MFHSKMSALKKAMKDALKRDDLCIANDGDSYIVNTRSWGVSVSVETAPNKFMAAIVELIGMLPEEDMCWQCELAETGVEISILSDMPEPRADWQRARDCAIRTPLDVNDFSHSFAVFQRKSDLRYLLVRLDMVDGIFSPRELALEETMPGLPSILDLGHDCTLLYKSSESLYWVSSVNMSEKAKDTVFEGLKTCNFFRDDWKLEPASGEGADVDAAAEKAPSDEELLPFA